MIDRNNKNEPCENSRSLNAVPLSDNAKVNRGQNQGGLHFFHLPRGLDGPTMRSTTMSNIIVTSLLLLVVFAAVVAVTLTLRDTIRSEILVRYYSTSAK